MELPDVDRAEIKAGFQIYAYHQQKMVVYPGHKRNKLYPVLGLIGEIGELYQLLKKNIRDSDGQIDSALRLKMMSEMSDILWYLSAFCDEWGLDFSEVPVHNLEKLYDRINRGVIHGSGDNR